MLDDEGENIAEPTKTILFSQLAPIDRSVPQLTLSCPILPLYPSLRRLLTLISRWTLFPLSCTPSAAAKGFYHCLVLCTKDVVGLAQEDFLGDIEVTLK